MNLVDSLSETADRPYGGESATQRRAARRDRLASAVLDLVQEHGIESLTVGAVCERAGVSKRHFYETYDNLDALAGEILADSLGSVGLQIAATPSLASKGADTIGLIAPAVESILATFDDPRLAKLYLEAAGNRGLRDARDHAVAQFVDSLLIVLTGDRPSDPRARLTAHLLVAGTAEVVAMWLRGDIDLTRDAVASCLVALGSDAAQRIVGKDYGIATP